MDPCIRRCVPEERPAVNEYSYWLDTLPAAPAFSPAASHQPLATLYDVLIIGAGYTGLSAARVLARSGASVLVLEREHAGWGASSRNSGQVLTGLKVGVATLVARYAEARARQLFDVGRQSIAGLEALIQEEQIDCQFARTGHVYAAWKPKHFEAFKDEQALLSRVFDHRVELVSRSDQRSEIGSARYFGVMVDEESRAINPVRYVHGLAAAALRAGAQVVAPATVSRVTREAGEWQVTVMMPGPEGPGLRTESAGEIRARELLVATNGYTTGATPSLQRRFVPIGSYIIATEPLSAAQAEALLPRRRMAFDSKNFLYYFRVTSDRRLLFGGRAEFTAPGPETTRRAAAVLRQGMLDVFPDLTATRVDYAWGGNVAFTRDEMPRAGVIDGLFYAGGYCGHGIAMATHLGEQIARRIAGESVDHPLFDDRFSAIPLYDGRPWFLPLVGAYYKVCDWIG